MLRRKRDWEFLGCAETVLADVKIICGERGADFSFGHYGDYILGSRQWASGRRILTSLAALLQIESPPDHKVYVVRSTETRAVIADRSSNPDVVS